MSLKEYKTKCDECSPTSFIFLDQFAVGNNTYSFTSRYTCIEFYPLVRAGISLDYIGPDIFGNSTLKYAESIVIRDLDLQASPSVIVGVARGAGEVIMHKHINDTTIRYDSPIPTQWNLQIYLTTSGNTAGDQGALSIYPAYKNKKNGCV